MPGLRPSTLVAAIGMGTALLALTLRDAWAQTEPVLLGGLRAGIDERPVPGTRRARSRTAAQPDRRSRVPSYGNPPGSGAGETGYLSTNRPVRAAPGPPGRPRPGTRVMRGPGPTPGPALNGAERRAVPGSANTGPSRVGAAIELPAGTATPLIRRRPAVDEDPFDPLGIRAGSFVLRPAIETTAGYDTNPGRTINGRGSSYIAVAPELQVRSDWSRHALNADLRGTYTWYQQIQGLDRPFVDARVNGRIDITSNTRADLEARTIVSTDNPGSPNLQVGLARFPIYTTVGGTAGITQRFNRFEVGLKGSIDRVVYQNSQFTDGSTGSNDDRNYNQYGAQLRAAYELLPGMKPFAEVGVDTRVRDLTVDSFGVQRDSEGVTGRVGSTFEFSRKLTGEISIGYLTRTYKDPTLPDFNGLLIDGSLIWTATGLTTVKLTAKTTADESTLTGVSGVLSRNVGLQVDHAFRRWLIGTARIGYGVDLYEGAIRDDKRYVAALGLTYKLTRTVQVKGEVRQEWLRSNIPGNDYTATIALVGLRLQR